MDEFLARYIDSYETFIDSINGVSTLVFAAYIYLMSRKIGIVHDGYIHFSHSWLLMICGIFCAVTFISNFLIHGTIANFFSEIYQGKLNENCKYDGSHAGYFHECIRRAKLRFFGMISFISCLLSILSISIWSCVYLMERRNHDRSE